MTALVPARSASTPVTGDCAADCYTDGPSGPHGHTAPRLTIVRYLDNGTHVEMSDGRLMRLRAASNAMRRQYGRRDRVEVDVEGLRPALEELADMLGMTVAKAARHAMLVGLL